MTARLAATTILVAALATLSAPSAGPRAEESSAVPMIAADGKSYLVEPGETLGDACARGALHQSQPEEDKSVCVPEGLKKKPEDSVSCKCYEITECKGSETRECKRHCRKDLCECCSI